MGHGSHGGTSKARENQGNNWQSRGKSSQAGGGRKPTKTVKGPSMGKGVKKGK